MHTWVGTASGLWSDDGNWTGGAPANGETGDVVLIFPDTAATFTVTDDIDGLNVDALRFTGAPSNYVISGGAGVTLNLTGSTTSGPNIDDQVGGNTFSATNLALVLAQPNQINVTSGTLTIDSVIQGSGGLTKSGSGTLVLGGANTYGGVTTVADGTLRIKDSGALGAGGVDTANVTIANSNNSGSGYAALNFGQSGGFVPPDTVGAAGPTGFVETVNQTIGLFPNKSTGAGALTDSLDHFFFTTGGLTPLGGGAFLSDPIVTYDEHIGRFIVGDQNVDFGSAHVSNFLIAVSKTSSPTTLTAADWNFYSISTTENTAGGFADDFDADYPGNFGYNHDAFVFTLNMFPNASPNGHVLVTSVDSSDLAAGVSQSALRVYSNDFNGFDLRPATMHDSVAGDPMWLVREGGTSSIDVVEMTSVLSNSASFTTTNLAVNAYSNTNPPLNPDGSAITSDIDSRIIKAALANNTLVASHSVAVSGTEDDARWYAIDVSSGTPVLSDQGDVSAGNNTYLTYPAIDINSAGDIGMTYMRSGDDSPSDFMSMYVTGRAPGDPAGTMRTPVLVPAGEGAGTNFDTRAGDLSGINVDPVDDTFWAASEFTDSGNEWGTAVANFSLGPPPNGTIVETGAVLEVDGSSSALNIATETLTLNGSGIGGTGALRNIAGANTWAGDITLASDSVIDTSANTQLTISGVVEDPTTTSLIKSGSGRLEVDSFSNLLTINQGDVQVDGNIADVVLNNATASVSGTGVIGQILGSGTGTPVGTVSPGDNTNATGPFGIGILTTDGANSTLGADTDFFVDLDDSAAGPGVGYDQLVVDSGVLDLNNAVLDGAATANVLDGDTFTIIQAINGGSITGTFNETFGPFTVPNTAYVSGQKFLVTYNRGANGSVVLNRVLAGATVDLTSSHNPSPFSENVFFTATITPENDALFDPTPPAPQMQFTIDVDGGPGTDNRSVTLDVTVNAARTSGTVTFDPQALLTSLGLDPNLLNIGFHLVTAKFLGDDNLSEADSNSVDQQVIQAQTTTSIGVTPGPVFGQPVTFAVTVAPVSPATGVPTGSVTVLFDGNPLTLPPGQNVLNSSGQVSFTLSTLSRDTHTIRVAYSGDTNYAASDSGDVTFEVFKADTAVTVTVPPSSQVNLPGQAFTVAAQVTVTPPGAVVPPGGVPTGTVTFQFNGGPGRTANFNPATGIATLSVNDLDAGTYTVTATYSGDGNFNGGSSQAPQKTVTVTQATTTTTVVSSAPLAVQNSAVTFTATITRQSGATKPVTGTVTFEFTSDNTVVSRTVGVNGAGVASVTLTDLKIGSYSVVAKYTGDANFLSSQSAPAQTLTIVPAPSGVLAVGQADGFPAPLRLLDSTTGRVLMTATPFVGFRGSVNVASGDVNGDGVADLIAAAGPGGATHVMAIDGATGGTLLSFLAYDGFNGAVNVAAGDIDRDGRADIITGANAPNGHVKVFSGATGALLRSYFAYPGFQGGVTVGAGDIDGDFYADVITGAGAAPTPTNGHVKVFSGRTGAELMSFFAFPGFNGGVRVSAGDLNGDGFAELITGALTGPPHVKVFDHSGALLSSFYAFDPNATNPVAGVDVVPLELNADGKADLLTAALFGTTMVGSRTFKRAFRGPDLAVTGDPFALNDLFGAVDLG